MSCEFDERRDPAVPEYGTGPSGDGPELPPVEASAPSAPEPAAPGPETVRPEPAPEPVRPEPADATPVQPAGGPARPGEPPRRPVQPYAFDDERRGWSEPVYEPAPSGFDAYTPGGYAYGPQNVQPQAGNGGKKKKEKKPKKSHGFLKAACLVVVCALVAGFASWAVVDYMLDHNVTSGRTVVLGGQASPLVSDDTPAEPGKVLTGNQIYGLGKEQVVGVNSSFNTTNIFGMTTPGAVSGSGFIISEDGYILTNYHVISYAVIYGGQLSVLTSDGVKHDAQIVGYVEDNDVAVIKIDAKDLKPVTFGDSDSILVGEPVYAIGNPLGELEYTMTDGIISAQDRVISTKDDITRATTSINMFQITAAVNSGNSGGPVYNSRGEVIGIVTAKYADEGVEGLGFAIPINDAVAISRQLIESGVVTGAGLGVKVRDVTYFFNEIAMETYNIPYGAYVESVNEGSAAEKAGIRPGDIITALGGREVSGTNELTAALKRFSPGDNTTVTVYHIGDRMSEGETRELNITLEKAAEKETTQQQQQQPQQTPSVDPDINENWGWWW